MKLDFFNELVNNLKENNFVQGFINELSNHLNNLNEKQRNETNMPEIKNNKNEGNIENDLRQEGQLYQVVNFSSNGVFLQNTQNNKIFEETNISKEMLDIIGNDSILRYSNGKYVYEEDLTDEFFDKMVGMEEYKKIQEDFIKQINILEIDSNTKYTVVNKGEEYTTLKYDNNKTIEVPNALIPFFAKENSTLYYKEGEFKKDI